MAFKATIEGKIVKVSSIEQVGENRTRNKQFIILEVDDDRSPDVEQWQFNIFGDRVEKLKLTDEWEGIYIKATAWFTSKGLKNQTSGEPVYIINADLIGYEKLP